MSRDAASNAGVPRVESFEFDKGDVHQCMGGDYWIVAARLYNFDTKKIEYYNVHKPVDRTQEWHRREYELSKFDPSTLGTERRRVCEHDLISHFDNEATAEQAREHYKEERADAA